MTIEAIESVLEVANIHRRRLNYALQHLAECMPLSGAHFINASAEEILILELFSSRFTKLQDLMGVKLFGLVIEWLQEPGEYPAFQDKLNVMERLDIIPNAQKWSQIRIMRNHLSHEYPNNPELAADYFNQAYAMAPYLLECLQRVETFVSQRKAKIR